MQGAFDVSEELKLKRGDGRDGNDIVGKRYCSIAESEPLKPGDRIAVPNDRILGNNRSSRQSRVSYKKNPRELEKLYYCRIS